MPTSAAAIRDVLPRGSERPAEGYVIDGVTPQLAHRPRTREEVARLLASVAGARLAVVPQGARTALALGAPLERYDVAVDMRGLDRIVAYEPADLTVTVEAGVTLSELQSRLAEHGQHLPVDPPPDDRVTIGGLLATARSGAWRGHLPAARDLVIGMTVAGPDGLLVRSGGRVVKNVSGYDLHRLHTGALGTLGVIVEASFKLVPLPEATRVIAVRCEGVERAAELALALRDAGLPLRALTLLGPAAASQASLPEGAHVLVELAGYGAAIEGGAAIVAREASKAGGQIADVPGDASVRLRSLAASPSRVVLRLGVPATAIGETVLAAGALGAAAWGHVAASSVVVLAPALEVEAVEGLRAHAERAGGFLVIESAPPSLRAAVDPLGGGERELLRGLRQQFDPQRAINPGRLGAGL